MGINLSSSFDRKAALPLDGSSVKNDISERDAIEPGIRYEGMVVYVKAEETNFQLIGGIDNDNWQEFSGSGGTGGGSGANTGKKFLVNNSTNDIDAIGEYLVNCPGMIVEYYLIRKAGGVIKTMSGTLRLETYPDEALSEDRWKLVEISRSENGGDSGVTFSLTEMDTEKSILVASLDDMSGGGHQCSFYFKLTKFSNDTGKVIILANNSINPISAIGEYLISVGAIIIDYFIYRKTDAGFKTMSGKLIMEGNPDALTNPDKWSILEIERSEVEDSGITFTLDDVDTEKSVLVVNLDNMAGDDHRCDFYYKKTNLSN